MVAPYIFIIRKIKLKHWKPKKLSSIYLSSASLPWLHDSIATYPWNLQYCPLHQVGPPPLLIQPYCCRQTPPTTTSIVAILKLSPLPFVNLQQPTLIKTPKDAHTAIETFLFQKQQKNGLINLLWDQRLNKQQKLKFKHSNLT